MLIEEWKAGGHPMNAETTMILYGMIYREKFKLHTCILRKSD